MTRSWMQQELGRKGKERAGEGWVCLWQSGMRAEAPQRPLAGRKGAREVGG